MERRNIIIVTFVLLVLALGFIFVRGDDTFSGFPGLNLDSIFSKDKETQTEEEENIVDLGYTLTPPGDLAPATTYGDGYTISTYEGESAGRGFQVFVMPFDEPGPITPERILLDVDVEIDRPKYISVDGIDALAFNSSDEGFGRTFEVWLVRGGKLYQVMTYAVFEKDLLNILDTWRFQ